MSDFKGEDYDFAAGSIKGIRTWKADEQGRLRGVTHPAIWKPGENVAACAKGAGRYTPCPALYSCSDPTCVPYKGHFVAQEPHDFDAECECGFWAYDEHTFKPHGDVLGIIEGYGKTTIGTRGFRCEKAKIVALCRNLDAEIMERVSLSLWLRLKRLYPDVEFIDNIDDMAARHGEAMRSWDEPGEGFWDAPAPESAASSMLVSLQAQVNAMNASMLSAYSSSRFLPTKPIRTWSL